MVLNLPSRRYKGERTMKITDIEVIQFSDNDPGPPYQVGIRYLGR